MNRDHESTECTILNVQISNFNDAVQPEIIVPEMKEAPSVQKDFFKGTNNGGSLKKEGKTKIRTGSLVTNYSLIRNQIAIIYLIFRIIHFLF